MEWVTYSLFLFTSQCVYISNFECIQNPKRNIIKNILRKCNGFFIINGFIFFSFTLFKTNGYTLKGTHLVSQFFNSCGKDLSIENFM